MRHTTRILAAGAVAATVLLASAGTATAGSDSIDDKRYDTLVTTDLGNTGGTLASKGTYAQRVAGGKLDIDKMTVNHGKEFVSVRVTFHHLHENAYVGGSVKVNGGTAEDFYFYGAPYLGGIQAESGPSGLESGTGCSSTTDTKKIQGSSKIGKGGFIQLYIPRSCFDNPKYVKVGASSIHYPNVLLATNKKKLSSIAKMADEEHYYDPVNSAYFGALEYTSWLARG
ncbi:hypothetical protein [Aeromicrobium sp. NPDC092404]|uniref:hypothetical protein n=1 Tax=Aeromicrobium sp. NPDC092404 TaxID=3154976 RepID=UPI0034355547